MSGKGVSRSGQKPSRKPAGANGGFRARARRKLTDDVLERIFQRRAEGWTWDAACAEEGVGPESLRKLAARDPAVREAYKAAQAAGAKWYADKIQTCASSGDPHLTKAWSAWAWLAERFHPTVFRKPADRLELKKVEEMTEDEILRELEESGALARVREMAEAKRDDEV